MICIKPFTLSTFPDNATLCFPNAFAAALYWKLLRVSV